jgi:hypothetical protein
LADEVLQVHVVFRTDGGVAAKLERELHLFGKGIGLLDLATI